MTRILNATQDLRRYLVDLAFRYRDAMTEHDCAKFLEDAGLLPETLRCTRAALLAQAVT